VFRKIIQVLRSNRKVYLFYRHRRNRYQKWRYGLKYVHPTSYVSSGSHISRDLVAHEYCFLSVGCWIGPKVELGPYVQFGPRVAIIGDDHCIDRPGIPIIFSGRPPLSTTIIEADVWVGYGAIIMTGRRIGRGAIVATGAVVTQDIPPYEIWGGVPARKIRDRFTSDKEKEMHDHMLSQPPVEGEYVEFRF
jgi:acetyltransferase-like isoleucine patch superfamily enzyme